RAPSEHLADETQRGGGKISEEQRETRDDQRVNNDREACLGHAYVERDGLPPDFDQHESETGGEAGDEHADIDHKKPEQNAHSIRRRKRTGGEGGIRTHGALAGTAVFKTAALNHSATSPKPRAMRDCRN